MDEAFAELITPIHTDGGDPETINIYCDGSCFDNGLPHAAAGAGIHFDKKSCADISAALPGRRQTAPRAEVYVFLIALEITLRLPYRQVVLHADCFLCVQGVNVKSQASLETLLGAGGWMARWSRRGWRNSAGGRIAHADRFKKACVIIKKFRAHATRSLRVVWLC